MPTDDERKMLNEYRQLLKDKKNKQKKAQNLESIYGKISQEVACQTEIHGVNAKLSETSLSQNNTPLLLS
jgi:hypothetical protein